MARFEYEPRINLRARLGRAEAYTDQKVVDALLDELLVIPERSVSITSFLVKLAQALQDGRPPHRVEGPRRVSRAGADESLEHCNRRVCYTSAIEGKSKVGHRREVRVPRS